MTIAQSIIYGVLQGVSEFLPISSSAHLVVIPYLLGWHIPEKHAFSLNILVQFASLLAIVIYFWQEIIKMISAFLKGLVVKKPFQEPMSRLVWLILLASIPAAVFGLIFLEDIKVTFSNPFFAAVFLSFTAVLLFIGEYFGRKNQQLEKLTWLDSLWIGFFQALALLPGISRSGSTITAGLLRKLTRVEAAKFSFIMVIPVMFGAGIIGLLDYIDSYTGSTSLLFYIPAIITSALVSYISINWLLKFLSKKSMYWFACYCLLLSALTLFKIY